MICPVAHSDIPTIEGCTIDLRSLRAKDILKHWNAMMKESPEWMKNLHRNFVNHFSALQGNISDEKQRIIVAYHYYFQSQKQAQKARKKHGIGENESVSMKDGKYYIGDKEATAQEVHNYFGIEVPESAAERMRTAKKKTEELQVRYGNNKVGR